MDKNSLEYIVINAKAGDKDYFNLLFEYYNPKFLYYAAQFIKDPQAPQDIVQDSWRAIIKNLKKLDNDASFSSWAYKILNRKCCDCLRSRNDKELITSKFPEKTLDQNFDRIDDHEQLELALSRLSNEKRAYIFLKFYEGFTNNQIAEIMKIPEGTAKSRISRALQALRKIMKGQ